MSKLEASQKWHVWLLRGVFAVAVLGSLSAQLGSLGALSCSNISSAQASEVEETIDGEPNEE